MSHRNHIDTARKKERVFLVGLHHKSIKRESFLESMQELSELAKTAETEVVDRFYQSLDRTNFATYIGKGKITEIKSKAKEKKVTTLIFDDNLSPAQARNISNATGCNVVDRTELILDIFSKHARTKQSKLQVELAQLEYSYTRLKNLWKHLSRIQGGIGFRGPGEKQIEVDRREIKKKIVILKDRIDKIEQNSIVKRGKRKKYLSVSLVGYTNAGKSTLFNLLTKEDRYTADQLFATLDATTRALVSKSGKKLILTDTIGFIRKIPHTLITSFHSTLLEVLEADLLLHVVDVSHPKLFDHIEQVDKTMKELGVDNKNILMVFNKIDKLNDLKGKFLLKKIKNEFEHSVFISAMNDIGIGELREKIDFFVNVRNSAKVLRIPAQLSKVISYLHNNAEVLEVDFDESLNEEIIKAKIPKQIHDNIVKQIEEYKFLEYINS